MKIWRRRRRGFFLDFNTRIRGNLCKSGCSGGKSRGPGPGASGRRMEQDEPHGQHGTGRHGKEPLHPHPSAEWRRRWSVCVGGGMQAVRARVARRTTVTRGGTGQLDRASALLSPCNQLRPSKHNTLRIPSPRPKAHAGHARSGHTRCWLHM
eukprot:gene14089-biopygen14152